MRQPPRIVTGAIVAGVISFVILYVTLALGLVFALSLLPDSIDRIWLERGFKLLGLLALLFPGYAAARIAGRNGLLHGLLTGGCAAAVGALFLLGTFSWEGSQREAVGFAIARTGGLGVVMGCLGGLLGEWRNRGRRV
jgi:hypothetical protein